MVEKLNQIKIDGVEIFVRAVKEHRLAFVLRGEGLNTNLSDSDPLVTGVMPLKCNALDPKSEKTVLIVNQFLELAELILKEESPANMLLLRGFAKLPKVPTLAEMFKLTQKGHEEMTENGAGNILKSFGSRLLTTLATVAVLFVTGWSFQILFN